MTGPAVVQIDTLTSRVAGRCYRAVDPAHVGAALTGSRAAGRYSRASEPTLYLSASLEGVAAALEAHVDARGSGLVVVELDVDAPGIVDLRDAAAREAAGIDLDDAIAPWQDEVRSGREPSSWRVRDRLVELGALGIIDPSRTRPGLWHLALFDWNRPGAPVVTMVGERG